MMKSGHFSGIGNETRRLSDWPLVLGLIGLFQIVVSLGLNALYVINLSESAFEGSIVVAVLSVGLLLGLKITDSGVGTYHLEWHRDSDSVGTVGMSYVTPKGRRRSGLIVSKVDKYPDKPLYRAGYSRYEPVMDVEGTNASVFIRFKNNIRFDLGLGFRDAEDMNTFVRQLGFES